MSEPEAFLKYKMDKVHFNFNANRNRDSTLKAGVPLINGAVRIKLTF